jgi:hypothetical protein
MEKYRPDASFEVSRDRLLTTTGQEKGETLRAIQPDRFTARPETTVDYTGGASHTMSTPYVDGEHSETHRIALGSYQFTAPGANGMGPATESDYGIKSKTAYPNNRSTGPRDDYFGAMKVAVSAAVAPFLDVLRPSRKENSIGTLRPYQNPKSRVAASYVYDPSMKLPPTIRETTESNNYRAGPNKNKNGGAYQVSEHQAIRNERDTTTDFYYSGGSSAQYTDMRSQTAEYNQRNNDIKSSTIDGRMVPGNMKIYTGNVNMVAKNKDAQLTNNRPMAPVGITQSPSVHNLGQMQGSSNQLYQNIQIDRSSPDVLNALQGNPFVIPYYAN